MKVGIDSYVPKTGRALKEDEEAINLADKIEESLGGKGAVYISDTVAHTPPEGKVFIALQVLESAIIDAIIPSFGGNDISGAVIGEGHFIYGRFSSIKLTSGRLIAYLGS